MQKTVSITVANPNLQAKAKELVKTFDGEFTTLSKVVVAHTHNNHDATLFNIVCTNVHNDSKVLDRNIKEVSKCNTKGKNLYE